MVQYFPIVTGSLTVTGSVNVSGSITTNSTITATTLVVQTITSSISAITGSTNFGSLSANTHTFTGSILASGSIGIGVSSATAKLDVYSIYTSDTTSQAIIRDNTGGGLLIGGTSGANKWLQAQDSSGAATYYSLLLNPKGGNIGIGTNTILNTSANRACVTLNGTSSAILSLGISGSLGGYFYTEATSTEVYSSTNLSLLAGGSNSITLYTNGTTRVNIPATSTNATLGSGGTLKIIGNGTTNGYTELQFYTYNAPSNKPPVSLGIIKTDNGGYENGEFYIATKTNNTDTAPVERVRITSAGYFKACNFASPSYATNYHQLFNNVYGDWIAEMAQFNGTPYGFLITYRNASPRSSGQEMMYINDSTGNVFKIGSNGNVYNLNNVYTSLSDIKLKENITDATPKLDKLMQVRVRNYNLKTDPDLKQIGVIAQELQEVFPGLIEVNYDRDVEGKTLTGETTLGVKYSVFVPILIKAIQELTARVQELENK